MPNTAIMNPAAPVAAVIAMDRPVTMKNIAEKIGKSRSCVAMYLSKAMQNAQTPTAILVRKTAEEMGYNSKTVLRYNVCHNSADKNYQNKTCEKCGQIYSPKSGSQKYCKKCQEVAYREKASKYYYKKVRDKYWYNGNFKTHEEEIARMQELRGMGYSNAEIAKSICRSLNTVRLNIGKQDPVLSTQNRAMGAHIRAQKNAARKAYLINKPIREHNARVEEHNKLKAQVAKMEAELRPQIPAIEKLAAQKIDFPLVDLHTVQPTALQ